MTTKMVNAPSPRGTSFDRIAVPESWFRRAALALDAAPRRLARDDEPNVYPEGGKQGTMGEIGIDNAGLLAKITNGDALDENELAALRKALGGEATDDDPSSNWRSGPLGPTDEPPVAEDDDIRDFLKNKGLTDDDCDRVLGREELAGPQGKDRLPENAQNGGMGGRTAVPIGMDQVLREASRRLAPRRGEGFSVGPYSEPSTATIGMDAATEDDYNKRFPGAARIGHV
jgi:hypothetical protein